MSNTTCRDTRAPEGHVGPRVTRHVVFDIARVLMPGEFQSDLSHLHNKLLNKEVSVVAKRGLADIGHSVTEQKRVEAALSLGVAIADEVAFAAAVQAEFVGAGGIHGRLRLGDESIKLFAKHRQIGLADYALEDEISLFLKLLLLLGGDRECQRFLLIWNVSPDSSV